VNGYARAISSGVGAFFVALLAGAASAQVADEPRADDPARPATDRARPADDPLPVDEPPAVDGPVTGDPSIGLEDPILEETPDSLPRGLPRTRRGAEVALRLSYGVPFGSSSEGTGIRDLIVGIIPAQMDVGYRLNERWWIGAYGAAGIGVKGEACRDEGQAPTAPTTPTDDDTGERPTFGTKCDAPNKFRVGIQALFHVLPTTDDVSPWIGLGVGYEWLNISETLGRQTFVQTFAGFELLNLQAGVDFALGSHVRLGPFAQLTLGRYTTIAEDASSGADTLPSPGRAIHQWLSLGVKASLGPFGE
jgi:hypothetical protein